MFLVTTYKVPSPCSSFAGLCLEAGDWSTLLGALATFAAVVVALGVSLWEGHRRRVEAKRLTVIYQLTFLAEVGRVEGVQRFIDIEVAKYRDAEPGSSMPEDWGPGCLEIAETSVTPLIDAHITGLVNMPIALATAHVLLAGNARAIQHHLRLLARHSAKLDAADCRHIGRVLQLNDELRGCITAIRRHQNHASLNALIRRYLH